MTGIGYYLFIRLIYGIRLPFNQLHEIAIVIKQNACEFILHIITAAGIRIFLYFFGRVFSGSRTNVDNLSYTHRRANLVLSPGQD